MTEFDQRRLRNAFGTFMTGVTVVSTHDGDGRPLGFTANSFASVSLDPPLVLVCLAKRSHNYASFFNADRFAVNVLSETQQNISNTFASPVEDRFASVEWHRGPFGSPVIDGVSAWFDCSMDKRIEAGDHLILIGRVEAYQDNARPGLGYVRGAYVTPAAEAEALNNSPNLMVSALIECQGKVLLTDDGRGRLTIPETRVGKQGTTVALRRLIAHNGVEAEPGFIYSVYEDQAHKTQHISFLCHAGSERATQGSFTELSSITLRDIATPVIGTILKRFAKESRMGNFGLYFGNELSGKVRPITSET